MSTTDRRKAEILEKRNKLAELRNARATRTSALSSAAPSRPSSTLGNEPDRQPQSRAQLDDLVSSLLTTRSESSSVAGDQLEREIEKGDAEIAGQQETDSEAAIEETSTVDTQTTPQAPPSIPLPVIAPPPEIILPVAPLPKPKVYYDKSIQTNFDFHSSTSTSTDAALDLTTGAAKESAEEMRTRIIAELEEERRKLDLEIESEKARATIEIEEMRRNGLSAPALDTVLASPVFLDFLSTSSKIAERALSDSYDYLRDYTVTADAEEGRDEKEQVRLVGTWFDESWGRGRSVTGVDWSPKFPELVVASYNKNRMAVNQPDGIAAVWNQHLVGRAEFLFHSASVITSIAFSPHHPNLVIGGAYSGQILLWDTRSTHPNPVLKSPLSSFGHTHPVYSLSMVGSQNANNLISASTDGTVCAWTLDMLSRPQETLELLHPAHNKTDEVSITALGFPEGETTTFWVGTEEGNIYSANRVDRAGAKQGLVQNEVYKGHAGPVSGLDFHPVAGAVDLSDLFLSCGVDWTVKLWRSKGSLVSNSAGGAVNGAGAGNVNVNKPIFNFKQAEDYVYDVKWHPHHPALFGSVDGAGKFDLWNLNIDTEIPIVSTPVGPSPSRGLNRLAWDKQEGKRAAIGSSDGKVYVYEISDELSKPKEEDWEMMRKACLDVPGEGR